MSNQKQSLEKITSVDSARAFTKQELMSINDGKRKCYIVTNPALSYINSLATTSSTGGQANARFVLERFSRFFLGPSYNFIDWVDMFKAPNNLAKAVKSFLIYKQQENARLNRKTNITSKNLEISPILEGLCYISLVHYESGFISERKYRDVQLALSGVKRDKLEGEQLTYGWLRASRSKIRLQFDGKKSRKVEHSVEAFSSYCICSCIHRFDWSELLFAPIVQASINEFLELGIQLYNTNTQETSRIRDYSPATADNLFRMIRGVAKSHWMAGNLSIDSLERIKAIRLSRGSRLNSGRYISKQELHLIFSILQDESNSVKVMRDTAMLSLMYACGLRRQEIVQMTFSSLDTKAGRIKIHGKGNKERYVYYNVDSQLAKAIDRWMIFRKSKHLIKENSPLFCKVNKHKQAINTSITPQTINRVCNDIAVHLNRRISPHDFRHSAATNLLSAGFDISTVSTVMGHADPKTTKRYDRRGLDAVKSAFIDISDEF
ncbi:tyrosine-type recombinase/integrase [Vibrio mediterranei]|uniref:Integrase n=1 Tax=Vibrio mediterranei TaxID=689 RepID=A0A3G4VQ51_9VIBR|nr:tyrosine-type recombinase/integrase [Vibrio mediterranei]AYV25011.1 integrase [Vibrio mediterranei]MCG9790794.1 tyrosine-type recombinase/integrase [Vibrio mediterranei]